MVLFNVVFYLVILFEKVNLSLVDKIFIKSLILLLVYEYLLIGMLSCVVELILIDFEFGGVNRFLLILISYIVIFG